MFIVGAAITFLGFFILIREHGSRIGISFLFMCLSIGFYLFATGANYASRDEGLSLLWIRIAQLGSVFIPSTILLSTVDRLNLRHRYRFAVASSFVLSTLITFGSFFTDLQVKGSTQFFWGRFAQYGPLGFVFLGFFSIIMIFVLRLYWFAYRQSSTVRQKKRLKGLLIAFSIGYLGAVDFLPAFGIPIYPFGYLPIGFFIVVSAYIIMRYQFTDITPELAADRILETMQSAVIVIDLKGQIRVTSRIAEEMLGYQKSELLGMDIGSILPALAKFNTPALSSGDSSSHEMTWHSRSGQRFDVIVSVSAITNSLDNSPVGIVYAAYDITQRRQSEEALRERDERLRQAVSVSQIGIFDHDQHMGTIYWSPQQRIILGWGPDESITLQMFLDLIHPEDFDSVAAAIRHSHDPVGDGIRDVEFRIIRRDGTVRWLKERSQTLFEVEGDERRPVRTIGAVLDVTERKQMEEVLRTSEEKFRKVFMTSPDSININRLQDGMYVSINDGFTAITGYTANDVIGKTSLELDIWADPADRQKLVDGLRKQGEVKNLEAHFRTKDSRIIYGLMSASLIEIDHIPYIVNVTRDITERKRAEDALRENQERLDLALQSAHMGVWHFDIKQKKHYFDDLTCQLMGIDVKAFTGALDEFFRAVHPEDHEKIKTTLARAIEQNVNYETTYRVVWPDESIHYVAARGRLVRDDKGQPVRVNGIVWDITDQRLIEDERLKTQKLESIGTLAGGIAHDFNNLLQGIFGYISMAKLTFDQKEKSLSMLTQAEKALHQSVNLTSQLLTFSKGGRPVKKTFALRPLIENSVSFALSGSRINHEIVIDENLHAVEADEGQIGQVIQNIVLNADQAMPMGGMIRVSVRNMPAATIVPPADLQGDLVEIAIQDQGMGIPAEHLTKIFDPYFTTKEKGSGLGLATVYSIINNHGGLVRVQSEVSKGTTFFIYLPASHAELEEPKCPANTAAKKKGRILVMDDEEIIRAVAGEMLTTLGHDVAFAQTGEAALEAYRAEREAGRPFDVVILDLTIRGGMGGMEALRRLVDIDPDVKAVVSSGYSDDAALSNYRKQGFRSFLKKPYILDDLQKTLNSLLA